MNVAAGTNCLTQTEDRCAELLATIPSFLAWIEDKTELVDAIHIDAYPIPIEGEYYSAIEQERWQRTALVTTAKEEGYHLFVDAYSNGPEHQPGGKIVIQFRELFPTEIQSAHEEGRDVFKLSQDSRSFKNSVVTIIEEFVTQASALDNFAIRDVTDISFWAPDELSALQEGENERRAVTMIEWSVHGEE